MPSGGACLMLPPDHGIGRRGYAWLCSMLTAITGWAAAAIGFSLRQRSADRVVALVGRLRCDLSYIWCKAMNRFVRQRDLGRLWAPLVHRCSRGRTDLDRSRRVAKHDERKPISVIIHPGYGMRWPGTASGQRAG